MVSRELAKAALDIANNIQTDIYDVVKPPAEGEKPKTNHVIDFTLVKGTRGYIERIVHQINGSYEHGWYDACAVMLRRLIETLLIECFEHHEIADKVKKIDSGEPEKYVYLSKLIDAALKEPEWSGKGGGIGRETRDALPKLKKIGDQSAHSRRYNANRKDIEDRLPDIRIVVQELLYLAELK